jgi:hypothetical protein
MVEWEAIYLLFEKDKNWRKGNDLDLDQRDEVIREWRMTNHLTNG